MRSRLSMIIITVLVPIMSVLTPVASSAATTWAAPTLAYTLDPAGTIATAVSWNAPSITPATINGYSVLATANDAQKSTVRCPTAGTVKTTTCTLQLVSGLTYAIVVKAEIVGGTANSLSSATATAKLVVPQPPTGVSVEAGDRQLLVSWVSSNATNVPPITGFVASVDQTHSCTSTQTSCTITGLTNRTGYLVSVTSLNVVGASAPATKSGTPYKLTPPTSVTAANSGGSSIAVSWLAADGNPSGTFTYVASAKDTGNNTFSCASTSLLTCTITGLTPGTSYAISVTATWSGQSVTSAQPYLSVTVFNAPGSMVITTVTGSVAGSQTINVTWSAAAANGANVSSYVVKTRDLSVANSVPVTACTVDATQANPNLACTVSGLINGDSYEVQVFAANGLTTQATKQVTPYGAPSAPRNVAVSAGSASGVLTVTWQAPSGNGGTSLLQYTAEALDQSGASAGTCTVAASATTCQIPNLTNGSSYSANVKVFNGPSVQAGFSSTQTSSSSSVTVYGPPSTINNLTVVVGHDAGDGSIYVTWEAPTQSNGMPLTGYSVTLTNQTHPGVAQTCLVGLSESLSCAFQGLTNGDSYLVGVVALNGQSSLPVTTTAVPYGVPGPVLNPVLRGGFGSTSSGSLLLSWSSAVANGKSVSYSVTIFDEANQPVGSSCTPTLSGGTWSCVVTGLTDGVYYTATIVARNGSNSFSTVTISDAVLVYGPPDAATSIVVTAGPGVGSQKLTVSWTAPVNVRGNELTSYVVWAMTSSNATSFVKSCTVAAPLATSCTITGLTNGNVYYIKVWAYNGPDTYSGAVAISTYSPFTNPGVVTGLNVAPGSIAGTGTLKISWNAPSNSGGKPVTGYTVTLTPGPRTCKPTAPTTTCTISGLQDGTKYTISVIATNAVGSDSDVTTLQATPYSAPDAATAGVVTSGFAAGSQTLVVSWTAASSGNGMDIERYVVSAKLGLVLAGTCTAMGATARTCTITGLANGTDYSIAVVTYNNYVSDIGSSATLSIAGAFHPYTVPGVPISVRGAVGHAGGGNGKIRVSWTAPSDNGGNTITEYTATAKRSGAVAGSCTSSGTTTCDITSLQNGQEYSLQVIATNGANSFSAAGNSASTANPYGAPTVVRSVSWQCIPNPIQPTICASGELIASWTAPAATNGRSIQKYSLSLTDTTISGSAAVFTTTPSVLTYDFTGLINGHQYRLAVSAINSTPSEEESIGNAGSPGATTNPFSGPKSPVIANVAATSGQAGSLTVTWNRFSGDDGGSPISSYHAYAFANGAGPNTTRKGSGCTTNGSALSCVLTGLQNGTTYSVQVYAANAATEQGPWSTSVLTGTPNGPVSGAGLITITPASSQVRAQVKNLNFGGGTPNADFLLKWDIALDGQSPCWIPVNYGSTSSGGPNSCDMAQFPTTFLPGSLENCAATYASFSAQMYCLVTGLKNGQLYVMKVTIQNSYTAQPGRVSPSWFSEAAMPSGPPEVPRNVDVVLSNSSATISWSRFEGDGGGSPLLSYVVTSIPSNLQCVVTVPDPSPTDFECRIEGLTLGLTYTFSIVAKNATGAGAAKLSDSVVVGAASPPGSVTAAPLDGGILVAWTQAAANGFPISLYTAKAVAGNSVYTCTTGGPSPTGVPSTATLSCVIVVPNCVSGQTCPVYSVSVTAQNVVSGVTQVSSATRASGSLVVYGVPGVPTSTAVTPLESSIFVKWLSPQNVGSGITMFVVTAVDQQKVDRIFYCTVRPPLPFGTVPSCTVGGTSMQIGHTFNVSVQAFDDVGGSASTAILTATTSTNPVPPVNVVAISESTDIVVSWTPFSPAGKNSASSYAVTASPAGPTCPSQGVSAQVVCTGVLPGVNYTFSVASINASGKSALTVSPAAGLASPLTQTGGAPSSAAWITSGGPNVLPTAGGIAFAPNGTMYTVSRLSQQVFATVGGVTSALALPLSLSDPSAIAVSSDSSTVFVADSGTNAIVSVSSTGVTASVLTVNVAKGLSSPNGLAVVGNTLYISDDGNGRIVAVPTTGGIGRVVASTVTLSSISGLAALQSGNLLVVDAGNGGLIQLNPVSGIATVVSTYDGVGNLLTVPDSIAVSPDGSTYFVTMMNNGNKYSVIEMSSSGGNMSLVASDVVGIGGIAVSPTGTLAYSAVRGVFTTQFRSTPVVPNVSLTPTKTGLTAKWTSVTAWDGVWTYSAKVAKVTPAGAELTCTNGPTGCAITGLTASTSYTLKITVTGATGTTPATYTYTFITPAK